MSIQPTCSLCGRELNEPGAIAWSPPTPHTSGRPSCEKYHICVDCWENHYVVFTDDAWVIEHPFTCRLTHKLADCLYTRLMLDHHAKSRLVGRYPITATSSVSYLLGGRTDLQKTT